MIFYPSDWLYNASVIGFSLAVERFFGRDEVTCNDDGTLEIDDALIETLFENLYAVRGKLPGSLAFSPKGQEGAAFASKLPLIAWLFLRMTADHMLEGNAFKKELENIQSVDLYDPLSIFKVVRPKYFYKDGPFVNAVGAGTKDVPSRVAELFGRPGKFEEYSLHCGFCGRSFPVPQNKRRLFVDNILVGYAGSSVNEFPNAYWDFLPSSPVCDTCSVLVFFHIFALERSPEREFFFVNSPSFKLSRDLIKQIKSFGEKPDGIFFKNVVDRLTALASVKAGWGSMGIEIYRIVGDPPGKYQEVKVMRIGPDAVERLTATPSVPEYLRRMNSTAIFEAFVERDYGRLFQLLHLVCKCIVSGSKGSTAEIERIIGRADSRKVLSISRNLPDLLYETLKHGGERMELSSLRGETRSLFRERRSAIEGEDGLLHALERLAYQIIEKTRIGNRIDVSYLLVRTFTANDEPLPEKLAAALASSSEEEFKLSVYAFIDTITALSKQFGDRRKGD